MLFEKALEKVLIRVESIRNNLLITLPNKQTILIDPLQLPSVKRSLKFLYGQYYIEFNQDVKAFNHWLNNQ